LEQTIFSEDIWGGFGLNVSLAGNGDWLVVSAQSKTEYLELEMFLQSALRSLNLLETY
jgi:hypothetical protein